MTHCHGTAQYRRAGACNGKAKSRDDLQCWAKQRNSKARFSTARQWIRGDAHGEVEQRKSSVEKRAVSNGDARTRIV